jgi:SAM-dependent methyltransferase
MNEPTIDPDILRYYSDEWDEDGRIRSGLQEIEFIRTQEIIRRFLPDRSLDILDVGGGGGVHAEWLLGDGHSVHLVDPVPRHVDQASQRLGDRPGFTCELGDARTLTHADASVDAVLLLGPLYHLTERADRLHAWREALRVVRVGGAVFGVGISRFASLFVGLSEGLLFDEEFSALVQRTLADGQHRNPAGREFFTTSFCHRPDELAGEAEEAGWSVRALLGIEGLVRATPHLDHHWNDPIKQAIIVGSARAIESEASLLGLGPHIMLVGQRTD